GLLKPLPPGKARCIIHRIDVKAETVARSMYKWRTKEPTEEEKWLMENTDKWIQEGVIEKISIESATHLTEASAPPKKDAQGNATLRRLGINYRQLNRITEKDTYEMPTAEKCYRMLEEKFFTKMDLQNGFWKIHLDEKIATRRHSGSRTGRSSGK